ncbi:hypothetical protein [Dyadobacter endophyticus]|nr:hypothetical protein [Dyadobacter endophyticus]
MEPLPTAGLCRSSGSGMHSFMRMANTQHQYLVEIYTRQFRRQLRINRKKIVHGTQFVEELNGEVNDGLRKRRLSYDAESNSRRDELAQARWEIVIQNELDALRAFSSE